MKRANRLLLTFGVVRAALSFVAVLAFGTLGQQPQQAPVAADVPVGVASQDLPVTA